jgi:hypothetical protein
MSTEFLEAFCRQGVALDLMVTTKVMTRRPERNF